MHKVKILTSAKKKEIRIVNYVHSLNISLYITTFTLDLRNYSSMNDSNYLWISATYIATLVCKLTWD